MFVFLGNAPVGFSRTDSFLHEGKSINTNLYGWWIVVAAFLNLFFAVGIIFYGFPVFYPAFVESLGFARAQVTQGFLLGFLIVGLPFGFAAGPLIDRIGSGGSSSPVLASPASLYSSWVS